MAEIDTIQQRIQIKLVYYGPALSGKTTNLTRLHDLLAPDLKGEIMALETQGDRTLFFDLFPLGFRLPSGWLVKFKLYTVPGQMVHDATRKAVLSRTDGVVFVADSQRNQQTNNSASFRNLGENLRRVGLDIEQVPLVLQYNKRDLDDIEDEATLQARWAQAPWPLLFASALRGDGVIATFSALLERLYPVLDAEASLAATHHCSTTDFVAAALGSGVRP